MPIYTGGQYHQTVSRKGPKGVFVSTIYLIKINHEYLYLRLQFQFNINYKISSALKVMYQLSHGAERNMTNTFRVSHTIYLTILQVNEIAARYEKRGKYCHIARGCLAITNLLLAQGCFSLAHNTKLHNMKFLVIRQSNVVITQLMMQYTIECYCFLPLC